jgi:hypothetical protein
MPRVVLNDEEQSLGKMPEHWGELLTGLDRDADGRGEVLTAVRFDGVDEPTFRQPSLIERGLRNVKVIEVETATPNRLLDEALAQGAAAAGTLSAAAGRIGSAFRSTDLKLANQQMVELCSGTRSMMTILATTAAARGVTLEEMECDGRALSPQLEEMGAQLVSIVEAQSSQDWLTVADILEYDFQPALLAWQPVFEALRSPIAKPSV